ncbi:MAG: alpha/beta hydrolase [Chitinophagaceae bacterium]|nr:alpha/beta hydrolase [Chitinophagaceae bacterium]
MKKIYCICGLGSDERIFGKLDWGAADVAYLPWLSPGKKETLPAYAARMSERITGTNITLVGVSFGGIMSIEIAKLIAIEKVILISSVKSHLEMPRWMKASGKLGLDTLLGEKQFHKIRPVSFLEPIENFFLGAETDEEKALAHEYRENIDPQYLKWSIHQIINWKNKWRPENLYHLHGTKDRIFPYKRVQPTHSIPGAGHFMIYQYPGEVSSVLQEII